jgi:hypothetical protein
MQNSSFHGKTIGTEVVGAIRVHEITKILFKQKNFSFISLDAYQETFRDFRFKLSIILKLKNNFNPKLNNSRKLI